MPQTARMKRLKGIGKRKPDAVHPVEASEESSHTENDSEDGGNEESIGKNEESSTTRARMSQWMDEDEDLAFEDSAPTPR
ncbi:hypothetical protein FRC14_006714, partial [Serendipita sp. 396]